MKRILPLLAAMLMLVQQQADAQLLWKVTLPGSGLTSYIFGTHHFAPSSVIENTPGLTEAIAAAEKIYGEIDLAPAANAQMMQLVGMASMAPADSTLSRMIDPAHMAALDSMLREYSGGQLNVAMLEPLKPAIVDMQLTTLQLLNDIKDFDPSKQLDTELQRRFVELGKPTGGLETVDDQIRVLLGDPIATQAKALAEAIDKNDTNMARAREMTAAYLSGDLATMYSIATSPDAGITPEKQAAMIDNRNAAWVETLVALLPTASLLVVVGAGHLPGDKGVISLLRSHGYNVEPAY